MPGFELIGREELAELSDVINNSGVLFRYGPSEPRRNIYKVEEFEKNFAQSVQAEYALGVTSGTAALRIALAALNIGSGEEVITSSFTFVATAEAIAETGATPIFAEIDATLNADVASLRSLITTKTRAIIAVHMLGVPADLQGIKALCEEFSLSLIEDCAWGCGGKLHNKYLGTWGTFGAFSFDYAKAITTGEGGMLVTNDYDLYVKARAWHDHGHQNSSDLPRWKDVRVSGGFNYRMSELQGAMGLAQLRKLDYIIETQRFNMKLIVDGMTGVEGVSIRPTPCGSHETADAVVFLLENKACAMRAREALVKNGVGTKILPEALNWHFAADWNFPRSGGVIPEASTTEPLARSRSLLERAIAIPLNLNMEVSTPVRVRQSFEEALGAK